MKSETLKFHRGSIPEQSAILPYSYPVISLFNSKKSKHKLLDQKSKLVLFYLKASAYSERLTSITTSIYKISEELNITTTSVANALVELKKLSLIDYSGTELLQIHSIAL